MKLYGLFIAVIITATISFESCFSKKTDSDIKTDIETKLKAKADMSGVLVEVADGIVSITGECRDEASKIECEKIAQEVNGVKTVINNVTVPGLTIAPPPAAAAVIDSATAPPIVTADPLAGPVAVAIKKFPTVTAEVKEGIITLSGSIRKNDFQKLMKAMNSLKPKKVEQNLTLIKNVKAKKQIKTKKRSRRQK